VDFELLTFEPLTSSVETFLLLEDFPILEASLAPQGIEALIGRDILAQCLFIFDGRVNTFSLSV